MNEETKFLPGERAMEKESGEMVYVTNANAYYGDTQCYVVRKGGLVLIFEKDEFERKFESVGVKHWSEL